MKIPGAHNHIRGTYSYALGIATNEGMTLQTMLSVALLIALITRFFMPDLVSNTFLALLITWSVNKFAGNKDRGYFQNTLERYAGEIAHDRHWLSNLGLKKWANSICMGPIKKNITLPVSSYNNFYEA